MGKEGDKRNYQKRKNIINAPCEKYLDESLIIINQFHPTSYHLFAKQNALKLFIVSFISLCKDIFEIALLQIKLKIKLF